MGREAWDNGFNLMSFPRFIARAPRTKSLHRDRCTFTGVIKTNQTAPTRYAIMSKNDRNLDLNFLSVEEANLIRDVLERDRQLKKREEERIR